METKAAAEPWADVVALDHLVRHERQCRDRGDWEGMRAAYTADAHIRVTWFTGGIDEFIAGSRRWSEALTKHRLAPPVITVRGDRAVTETSVQLELRLEFARVLVDLVSSVRLLCRAVRTPGGWKLASMDAIYEKDQLTPVDPTQQLTIDQDDLAQHRPSYRFLAYCGGGSLPTDIPGDDRPDLTAPIYAEADTWLTPTA
jgi:hypothetical protein